MTFTGNELRFGYLLSDNLCSRYPATNPCHIDRIESLAYALPKVASAPPPAPAAPAAPASPVSNISPADGATNVATSRFITPYTNTTLAWTWNGGPWLFKLCISTSSRALNASNCQQSHIHPDDRDWKSLRPGRLATVQDGVPWSWPIARSYTLWRETTYYWGIVARDDDGVNHTYGPWSFTTEARVSGYVAEISPSDGATNVAVDSEVRFVWEGEPWLAKLCGDIRPFDLNGRRCGWDTPSR